jgi:hypothetical protein
VLMRRREALGMISGAASCRVLWLPITAVKERAQRDNQLARVAREDLARKLAQLAQNLRVDERRTGA